MIYMLGSTTGSDIIDHVLVALVVSLPLLIPVLVGLKRNRIHVEKATEKIVKAQEEAKTALVPAASQVTDILEAIQATITDTNNKLDDHLVNSDDFWNEQRTEMAALAAALGEHTQDHHVHEIAMGNVRKATSEPLTPGKPTPRLSRGRQRPKATGG